MKRKQYILFGYDTYYPGGGLTDEVFRTDNIEEIKERVKTHGRDVYEVLDLDTGNSALFDDNGENWTWYDAEGNAV